MSDKPTLEEQMEEFKRACRQLGESVVRALSWPTLLGWTAGLVTITVAPEGWETWRYLLAAAGVAFIVWAVAKGALKRWNTSGTGASAQPSGPSVAEGERTRMDTDTDGRRGSETDGDV